MSYVELKVYGEVPAAMRERLITLRRGDDYGAYEVRTKGSTTVDLYEAVEMADALVASGTEVSILYEGSSHAMRLLSADEWGDYR